MRTQLATALILVAVSLPIWAMPKPETRPRTDGPLQITQSTERGAASPDARLAVFTGQNQGEQFGQAVAVDDGALLVGAPRAFGASEANGAVDVFRSSTIEGVTSWITDAVASEWSSGDTNSNRYHHDSNLMPIDGAGLSYLGNAIDIDGAHAVIGLRGQDLHTKTPPAFFDNGGAIVLERTNNSWSLAHEFAIHDVDDGMIQDESLQEDLNALGIDHNTSGWQLGHDVAIHGDLIALSAPYAEGESGLVLIFKRIGNNQWQYEALITRESVSGESSTPQDFFGYAIALHDDLLVIGSPNVEFQNIDYHGAAYVFRRVQAGDWQHVETLNESLANDPLHGAQFQDARFGWSVDIQGGVIAVGQPGALGLTQDYFTGRGTAWVFESSDPTDINDWNEVTEVIPDFIPPTGWPPFQGGDQIGRSVALSSCHLAVGAPGGDSNQNIPGVVYLFERNGVGQWPLQDYYQAVEAPAWEPGSQWGSSVDITADLLAIGARYGDPVIDGGAAELWRISCDCNGNGLSDSADIENDPSLDCDSNGLIDSCEIEWDPSRDCNGNNELDDCEISPPDSLTWPSANGGNDHNYAVINGTITAANAWVDAAVDPNAYMASLTSFEEAAFVGANLNWDISTDPIWIGGEQAAKAVSPDTSWFWQAGDPWFWTPWLDPTRPQPDDAKGQETALLALNPGLTGSVWDWDDRLSTDQASGWLIEYDRDCDGNGVLDSCDISNSPSRDCNGDGRIDDCQLDDGQLTDCNNNGTPDVCDLAIDPSLDCDSDGQIDACQINDGFGYDCNANGELDACDITNGTSNDDNNNQVPDECELMRINEVLVAPNEDHNLDGTIDSSDQFIELINFTSDPIDLSGWRIRQIGITWYTFPNGTTLDEGCALVLFTETESLTHLLPAITLSANRDSWPLPIPPSGSTRTIDLLDGGDVVIDEITWGDEVDNTDGTSLVRCPDITGEDFVLHNNDFLCDLTNQNWHNSPGRKINGDFFTFPQSPCSNDEDGDGVPDPIDNCDLFNPEQLDCNLNGIGDVCDIADWVSGGGDIEDIDCNLDQKLDQYDANCELALLDCNENEILDVCDIASGLLLDCNLNTIPDNCEIEDGTISDCNENGIPDSCDILTEESEDCTDNGVPDECDLANGDVFDDNENGRPDVCDYDPACDINGDGRFNVDDLLAILQDPDSTVQDLLDYLGLGCAG